MWVKKRDVCFTFTGPKAEKWCHYIFCPAERLQTAVSDSLCAVCSTCSIRDLFPSAKMAEQTHTQHTSGELTNSALIIFPFNSQLIVRISAGVGVWRFTLKNLHWYTWVTCIYIYSLSFHALMIKCREEKGSKNRWHFKKEESEEKELESSYHEAGAETLDYWSQACRRESQPISLADKR